MEPGARPDAVPRWGGDSTMVQPATGAAAAGLDTGDRVPAQWINWIWNRQGAWIDFLRGPNVEHWTRYSTGTQLPTLTRRPFEVDVASVEAATAGNAFRYVMVGESSGASVLRVSKTGAEWVTRTNTPATGATALTALFCTGTRWLLGDDGGGGSPGIYYGAADDGSGSGPVGNASASWTLATAPALDQVQAFASNGTRLFALTVSSGFYSDDDGQNWTEYTRTGTARSADGRDVVWDGARYVFITQSAQVYASTDGATFGYKGTFSATSTVWRLAAGISGEVIAWRRTTGTTVGDFYRSTDGGVSWSTITPSSSRKPVQITSLRYASGQWIASSAVAPYLWSSNDLLSWRPLRAPVPSDVGSYAPAVDAVAWDGGAWCAVGRSFALQCLRASDPGGATYDGEDGGSTLADAGYLRGREVSSAAPSVGNVLTWNGTTWAPAASGGGGGGTSIPFTAATLVTLTPGSFPAYVRLSGRALQAGGAGRWHGSIDVQVYDSGGGVYAIDAARVEGGTISPTVTVNTATGQIKITYPVAMTGELLAVEV